MLLVFLGCLAIAAWGLAARLAKRDAVQPGAELLLVAGTCWLGLAILLGTLLGYAGHLRPIPLLVAAALAAFSALGSGGLALARDVARRGRRWPVWRTRDPAFWFALLASTLLLGWAVRTAVLPSFGWDDYSYHLPWVTHAAQSGDLGPFETSNLYINAYPKSIELLGTLLVVFGHGLTWVELIQGAFVLLAMLAVFALSRRLGASHLSAAVVAFIPLQLPMVLMQLKTAYVDVAVASLVCVLAWSVVAAGARSTPAVLAAVVSGGILIGVKLTGAYLGATLPMLAIVLWARAHGWTWTRTAVLGLGALPILIALGGHWLIRNVVLFHNPLYPFILRLGPWTFPGRLDPALVATWHGPATDLSPTQRWLLPWLERKTWWGFLYTYDTNFAGWGPAWLALLLPAWLVSLGVALRGLWKRQWSSALVFFPIALLGVYALDPGRQYQRYTLYLPLLCAPLLAVLLDRAPRPGKGWFRAVYAAGFLWGVFHAGPMAYLSPDQGRALLTGGTPPPAPFVVGAFYGAIGPLVRDEDLVLYTYEARFIQPLWNERLANRVVGSALGEDLAAAIRRTGATLVLAPAASFSASQGGAIRTEKLIGDEDGIELRRVLAGH